MAIFSDRHDLGALDPTQKSIFRDRLPEVVGDSDLQMLNSVKLSFFRHPVYFLILDGVSLGLMTVRWWT